MIPWSPLARGFLTRPWDAEATVRVNTDAAFKVSAGGNRLQSQCNLVSLTPCLVD